MKTLRPLLLIFCTLLVFATARGTSVIPPSFDELVDQAEFIFQGTVTDVKAQWVGEGGQRHIVSYITLKVEDAIKGNPGASYTIRMLGGTVDGETMRVSDSPQFKTGDRDILFVEHNGTQFIPLVGIMHGRFRVQQDKASGEDVVMTDKGEAVNDLAQLGKDEDPTTGQASDRASDPRSKGKALGSAAFKSAIRTKLGKAHS